MQSHDVFNGDADGLCSLHQLRLSEPSESLLITGVKRDIKLLSRVECSQDCSVTVFDISFDKNRDDVLRLLEQGAEIEYFDHHFAGEVPNHARLSVHIDVQPDRGTSFIVDQYTGGRYRAWAVVGTFGDNFDETARRMARSAGIDQKTTELLQELGVLLNYNSYGVSVDDLYFHPADIYRTMREFAHPVDFIQSTTVFADLKAGYSSDMDKTSEIRPEFSCNGNEVYILPNESWARRVSGVFANRLSRQNMDGAHAVLTGLPSGGYVVSVRAPLSDRRDAHTLCMKFPTGGGRAAAAGINLLPESDVKRFIDEFQKTYTHKRQ